MRLTLLFLFISTLAFGQYAPRKQKYFFEKSQKFGDVILADTSWFPPSTFNTANLYLKIDTAGLGSSGAVKFILDTIPIIPQVYMPKMVVEADENVTISSGEPNLFYYFINDVTEVIINENNYPIGSEFEFFNWTFGSVEISGGTLIGASTILEPNEHFTIKKISNTNQWLIY